MARLYMDEQFPKVVSQLLSDMGHDVLTVQEAGKGNLGIPDEEVLLFAIEENRAVVTLNRDDFIRLHRADPQHCGIIVCTNDPDRARMAIRLHESIVAQEFLQGNLIRVVHPAN
jgi:predicted nuclease of predicted toxin-antitoxin system